MTSGRFLSRGHCVGTNTPTFVFALNICPQQQQPPQLRNGTGTVNSVGGVMVFQNKHKRKRQRTLFFLCKRTSHRLHRCPPPRSPAQPARPASSCVALASPRSGADSVPKGVSVSYDANKKHRKDDKDQAMFAVGTWKEQSYWDCDGALH